MKQDIISKMQAAGMVQAPGINWPVAHFEGGGDVGKSRPGDAVKFALPKPKTPAYTGKNLIEQVQNANPSMKPDEAKAVAGQLYKSGVTDLNATQAYGYADKQVVDKPAVIDDYGNVISPATYRTPTAADINPEYNTDLFTADGKAVPTTFDLGGHYTASIGVGADGLIKPTVSYQEPSHGFFGDLMKALGPIAPIAIAVFAPELLPSLGAFAAPALSAGLSVLSGEDPLQALEKAGLSYVGGQVASGVTGNLTDALGSTAAKVVGNVAGQEVSSGGNVDPLQALISGGIGAGTNAVLGQIDGFSDLSKGAQAAVTNVVANTLRTGDLDPAKAVQAAITAGFSAVSDAAPKSSDMIPGYFAPGGEGYVDTSAPAVPETPVVPETPGTNPDALIGNLQDAGLTSPIDYSGISDILSGGQTETPEEDIPTIDVIGKKEPPTVDYSDISDILSGGQTETPPIDYSGISDMLTGGQNETPPTEQAPAVSIPKIPVTPATKTPAVAPVKTVAPVTKPAAVAQATALVSAIAQGYMPSVGDVAHIKSLESLFGPLLGEAPPEPAHEKKDDSLSALEGMDQEYASGGHVDDFSVEALLHILRS